ncbi:unnamed protein product [Candida verbasci]|uniref:polynucleotide adenylyltransferase n=1 Tax=Candida verbasci TaxID=1227364 RepID=A0A9W4XA45_9ASCO|nr:unnamed protein product [Candida verbasci]
MATKRKREQQQQPEKLKKRKNKKQKTKQSQDDKVLLAQNSFEHLQKHIDDDSDSELIFDYDKKKSKSPDEIILVDSESEDESIEVTPAAEELSAKKQNIKVDNELTQNQDFIGFGFSSSSDEANDVSNDVYDLSDDGILSADENGVTVINGVSQSLYPWVKNHDHSRQREIADWLTMEIKDFVNYISPSSDEITLRNNVINRLKKHIGKFWPGTELQVFGSCATDLYLPGSDIDMVVISKTGDYEERSRLYQLSTFLRAKNLAKNVEVIAHAKVPIIKFIDPESNFHIDVSFERTNGLDAAKRIRRWLDSTPGLRELVLVIKQFLRSRKLNNVHVGGLGGYATIIMCYHFMRLHPKISTNSIDPLENLGALLIEFFELYGRNFAYDNLIIALEPKTEAPMYYTKGSHPVLVTCKNTFSIVIQDPADPRNNITRSSYNLRDLKKAFGGAYQLLVAKCYQLHSASYKDRLNASILGDIITYRGKERDFNDDRDKVSNTALINHEESDSQSDGADGNDKYYFSDMTDESDDVEDKYIPRETTPITNKAKDTKKLIEDYLSLENSDDENNANDDDDDDNDDTDDEPYDPENVQVKKPKSLLDKDIKREYWRQKGM